MKYLSLLSLLMLALVLAACNGDDDEKDATTEPVNAAQLVSAAAQKLDETSSFQLRLRTDGAPVNLSISGMPLLENMALTFKQAEGEFAAPDKLHANVIVALDDTETQIELIAIGNEQFINNSFITGGNWQTQVFADDFSPATLVSPELGIASAIRSLQNPQYIGETDLDGIPVHHIQGMIDAAKVQAVTVGLIGTATGNIKADLYIRTEDGLLEQLNLEEPLAEGAEEPITWTIGLYGYNEEYTIEKPEVE